MIFVGKSTRYPDVDPWFISTTGFRFPDTYRKATRKALRRLLWDFSRLPKEEDAYGLPG